MMSDSDMHCAGEKKLKKKDTDQNGELSDQGGQGRLL